MGAEQVQHVSSFLQILNISKTNSMHNAHIFTAINTADEANKRDAQDSPDFKPWVEMGNKYGMLSKFEIRIQNHHNRMRSFFISFLYSILHVVATTVLIPMGMEIMNNTQQKQWALLGHWNQLKRKYILSNAMKIQN